MIDKRDDFLVRLAVVGLGFFGFAVLNVLASLKDLMAQYSLF